MKTVEYWEGKREAALRAIEQFNLRYVLRAYDPPPRKGDRSCLAWQRDYLRWLTSERVKRVAVRRCVKLLRRLNYIEARIRATTPTFWSKL